MKFVRGDPMNKAKITTITYPENSSLEKETLIFNGRIKHCKTSTKVQYLNENKEVGRFEIFNDEDVLHVRNEIKGATGDYYFDLNKETCGTYRDDQYRQMNFKIKTNSIQKTDTLMHVCYDIISFNGIKGIVHFDLLMEEIENE